MGAGGMGVVFRATDTRLGRAVAIKTVNAPFSERFEREARAISALNHPHICALFDIGGSVPSGGTQPSSDAQPPASVHYLVMELVEGDPMRGPMPWPEAVRHAADIYDALAAAHAKRIVHRDLKPENVLLTPPGAKIIRHGEFLLVASNVAEFYAVLDDRAKALEWLDRAVRAGDERADWFERNPLLAGLRKEQRFRKIIDGVRARAEQRRAGAR